MKKNILKITVLTLITFAFTACEFNNIINPGIVDISGAWENSIKNSDGAGVITTLDIKDIKFVSEGNNNYKDEYYTYSASLNTKLTGNQSETLKITTDKINISGTIRGNDLAITDVESESESITTASRLILSKDKNYLTLIPSDIKFRRKPKS